MAMALIRRAVGSPTPGFFTELGRPAIVAVVMKAPDGALDQLQAVYHIIQINLEKAQIDDAVASLVRRTCNSARCQDDGLPMSSRS
jgi:hypothetical protein